MAKLAAEGYRDRRGLLMAQLRRGGFRQKPLVQKVDYQLAAKGAADAGMEVSLQGPLEVSGAVPQTAA